MDVDWAGRMLFRSGWLYHGPRQNQCLLGRVPEKQDACLLDDKDVQQSQWIHLAYQNKPPSGQQMLNQCWFNVSPSSADDGLTLKQHWFSVMSAGYIKYGTFYMSCACVMGNSCVIFFGPHGKNEDILLIIKWISQKQRTVNDEMGCK